MNRDDIVNYSATELLRDERLLTIRAIRPDDKGLVLETLHNVSAESIYRRVFAPRKSITPEELRQATEVDFWNVVALVAVMEKDGEEHVIGGGRYVRSDRTGTGEGKAEVAFLIEDAFQGLGIGSRLLKHLVAIGRESGITQFEAEVLPWNESMLRVFDRSGLKVTKKTKPDFVYVVMELTG